MNDPGHERYEILLVKATDDQLSDEERSELEDHTLTCRACRDELRGFAQIKELTDAMTSRILMDATIEPPREPRAARLTLGAGFLLVLLGALLLLGFAGYTLIMDSGVPLVVKVGAGAAGLGVVLLLTYVLVIRSRSLKKDPYKEIDL